MNLSIMTPDREVYTGEVSSVTVPGTLGMFQVLENHAPIISILSNGTIKVKTSEGVKTFEAQGGVIEVLNNKIIILAEQISADAAA